MVLTGGLGIDSGDFEADAGYAWRGIVAAELGLLFDSDSWSDLHRAHCTHPPLKVRRPRVGAACDSARPVRAIG